MSQANLSETLFKPRFKHPETSTLVFRADRSSVRAIHSALDGDTTPHWYRMINRLLWVWRGVDPRDILDVQARIISTDAERTNPALFDTVIGYRGGNWIFEWSKQAMLWQQRAGQALSEAEAGQYWLNAANLYSIAGYPFLKGDVLSEQAQTMSNRAYQEAARRIPGALRELNVPLDDGGSVTGFLHMPPQGEGPYPTLLLCGALDMLQSDYYTLFSRYLAPRGIAMLTVDMPAVGFSAKWKLTQDASMLHQQVLKALPDIPWIDHTRVAALGFRFGANVAVRLAYLEPARLRAVACLGPVVHALLTEYERQQNVPDMLIDVLANRLGMSNVSESHLSTELKRYSLKTQGLLGRRCPVPMLSGYWQNDLLSPEEESQLIARSSTDGKLLAISSRPVYKNFDKALSDIVGWIEKRLR